MLAMSHSPGARLRPAPAAAAGSAAAGFGRPRCTGSASGRVASGSRKRGRAVAAPSTASGSGSSAGALAASSWSTRRRSASRRRRTALSSLRGSARRVWHSIAASRTLRRAGAAEGRARGQARTWRSRSPKNSCRRRCRRPGRPVRLPRPEEVNTGLAACRGDFTAARRTTAVALCLLVAVICGQTHQHRAHASGLSPFPGQPASWPGRAWVGPLALRQRVPGAGRAAACRAFSRPMHRLYVRRPMCAHFRVGERL